MQLPEYEKHTSRLTGDPLWRETNCWVAGYNDCINTVKRLNQWIPIKDKDRLPKNKQNVNVIVQSGNHRNIVLASYFEGGEVWDDSYRASFQVPAGFYTSPTHALDNVLYWRPLPEIKLD